MIRNRFLPILCVALATFATGPPPTFATMPPQSGTLPPEVAEAIAAGALQLPEPPPPLSSSAASVAQAEWNIPVLLVGYADAPLQYAPADFDVALFDSTGATGTGSVFDYYTWASRGRIRGPFRRQNPGVHSPTKGGFRLKWTQTPSEAGQEGSPHSSARQSRRQRVSPGSPTQVRPRAQAEVLEHGSPSFSGLFGMQAAWPVGSTILQS